MRGVRWFKRVFVSCLLWTTFLLISSQSILAERLPIKSYTTADGLAHNEVNKIVRDSRGFLWFCTSEGLSRFDGYNFTNFGIDQGLPHRVVNDFLETKSGELWVATNAGLVRFDPRGTPSSQVVFDTDKQTRAPMFSVVVPEDTDRNARTFTVLLEGKDGTIWAGTNKYLYRLVNQGGGSELNRVDLGIGNPNQTSVLDLLEDRQGNLWVASFSGVFRFHANGQVTHLTKKSGLPDENVHDLIEDHLGRIWAGTRLAGFFRFADQIVDGQPPVAAVYNIKAGMTTDWVFQVFESADNQLWIATNKGLVEFTPESGHQPATFRAYTRRNGLSYQEITSVVQDIAGNIWLGTNSAGAMRLARSGFVTYDERDGIVAVNTIFEDGSGSLCFRGAILDDQRRNAFDGISHNLLSANSESFYPRFGCFDGEQFEWFKPAGKFESGWVVEQSVTRSVQGEWWIGGGDGLYRFPSFEKFSEIKTRPALNLFTPNDGLSSPQIFRVFADSKGDVWISSFGLAHWERASGALTNLVGKYGLPSGPQDYPRSFGEDRAGNVWIGFITGVARYSNGQFRYFSAADGFPPGAVMHVYADSAGRLWLGSSRSGLIRIDQPYSDKPTFKVYTTREGLSSNSTEVIVEDLAGRIYVATGRGIDQLDPRSERFRHFTIADGLAPGTIVAAFRDSRGTLWFGTQRGLSRFASVPEEQATPPRILITSVRVADETKTISALGESEINLPDIDPGRNQLQVGYVALNFSPGEVLRFQYKLGNADWSAPSEQRTLNLASLSPGQYQLHLRAVSSLGSFSVNPAVIHFVVLRPVWQRWWFIALVVVALMILVYAIYRARLARIVELSNVRTRIATDLHDDIGANLTKISVLSEVARQKGEEDGTLGSIARISRESVAAMSDIVWAINPERDHLNDLVRRMRRHAEETCLPNDIELEFIAPDDSRLRLGIEARRTLYLIFKEAINNAARHSGCWRIEVQLTVTRDNVLLEVKDNGLGFEQADEGEGNGLLSMKRRANEAGGKLKIVSGSGNGTLVQVRLPYSQSPISMVRK